MDMKHIGEMPTLADGRRVPLSPAVMVGDFIFLSGQLGLDDDGIPISDDIAEQTRQCIQRISDVLHLAGSDLSKVIKATLWITESNDFPIVNEIWSEIFGIYPPARSTVVSELLIPGAKIEIEVVALF